MERHPEAVDDPDAVVVEESQRHAGRDTPEVDVAAGGVGAARVLGAAAMRDGETGEATGPERQARGAGDRGGDEADGDNNGTRRHARPYSAPSVRLHGAARYSTSPRCSAIVPRSSRSR